MKLSDAIRLGAMMGPQEFGSFFGKDGATCAAGAAMQASGIMWLHFPSEWPFLTKYSPCPACERPCNHMGLIAHLNDTHSWTRERIADWVATIEPAEVHASETIREVQYGQGPLRSTPEEETFETKTILRG